ncbi:3-dehydroquinate synthase II family protein [Streptomyces hygroscopicus]|uniref:3-dehydroquinate synthase II family protein n=1 Tax=Streptomyces hygroscopicus TaxID=1912 RepID=UPI000829AD39|nr:3-dehydroquinate synthase II [Streptomyces hygroscopicus]GLV77324.1 3-dehydroquinate synthase II [Streptomyces hygroscopicus subsp. hygroscopicus]
MKFAWIDLRTVPQARLESVVDAAIHTRMRGVLCDDEAVLESLPPTVTAVTTATVTEERQLRDLGADTAGWVDVHDEPSLRLACAAAVTFPCTVVRFADPTKIPLEIVLAAADRAAGELVTVCADLEEAATVLDVLERGSDGVLLAPSDAAEVFALARLLEAGSEPLPLTTLTVDGIEHHGLGDRVCVDTCTHFAEDEGILVGSYSTGFILCCSETHPLPYMPTRPFRVNAGALHSYVLGPENRTNYLSELRSGSTTLAVNAEGRTRPVTVGRAKLESRPLLTITARSAEGVVVSLTVQDDWHVRVLGPGAKVHNVTELRPGDELLGYLATDQRHVGFPIGEFCREN